MFDTVKSADGLKVCRKYPIKFRSLFSNKLESSDSSDKAALFQAKVDIWCRIRFLPNAANESLWARQNWPPPTLHVRTDWTAGWLTPLCLACRAGLGPQVSHRCRRWWNPSPSVWPWSSGCLLPVGGSVWCLKDFKWGNTTRCRRVRQQCFPH